MILVIPLIGIPNVYTVYIGILNYLCKIKDSMKYGIFQFF